MAALVFYLKKGMLLFITWHWILMAVCLQDVWLTFFMPERMIHIYMGTYFICDVHFIEDWQLLVLHVCAYVCVCACVCVTVLLVLWCSEWGRGFDGNFAFKVSAMRCIVLCSIWTMSDYDSEKDLWIVAFFSPLKQCNIVLNMKEQFHLFEFVALLSDVNLFSQNIHWK